MAAAPLLELTDIAKSFGAIEALRGAAALAVAGVLSPRFGQMFAVPRERDIAQDKGWAA